MAVTVRIRPMRLADIRAVLPLERQLFAADPPWTADIFRSELAGMPGTRWYVVAELRSDGSGREIVGYAGLRLPAMPDDDADVYTIAVAPDQQRRGIGTRLLTTLIGEARAACASSLMLEVRADNEAAIALYAKHGFEEVAVRNAYYGGSCDGLVMRRSLTR